MQAELQRRVAHAAEALLQIRSALQHEALLAAVAAAAEAALDRRAPLQAAHKLLKQGLQAADRASAALASHMQVGCSDGCWCAALAVHLHG